MRKLAVVLSLAALVSVRPIFAADDAARPNVLFIMSDDMRNELSCSGGMAKTPNLDKLAAAGVRFDRTFCQYPLCNPSRSSMLTGRDVADTGVLGNRTYFRDVHPDFVTLPQYFQQHGYITIRNGKIFHGGLDDQPSWTQGGTPRGTDAEEPDRPSEAAAAAGATTRPTNGGPVLSRAAHSDRTIVVPGDGKDENETRTVERTIAALEANKDRPFFMPAASPSPIARPLRRRSSTTCTQSTQSSSPSIFGPTPPFRKAFPRIPFVPAMPISSSAAMLHPRKPRKLPRPTSLPSPGWMTTSAKCSPLSTSSVSATKPSSSSRSITAISSVKRVSGPRPDRFLRKATAFR